MPTHSALIFDLDGTLIDSAPDIAAAINAGFACNGWPALDARYVERFIGYGPRRLITDILADQGIHHDDASVQIAYDGYREAYMADPASRTRFYPHVREDLEALHGAGIRLGICTNKTHDITAKVLAHLRLDHLFEAAIGADAVPACKPDPGHLLAVAQKMDLHPGTWAYVGDTNVDRAAAVRADVPFYVVPWGGGPKIATISDYRLTRLADLLHRGVGTSVAS